MEGGKNTFSVLFKGEIVPGYAADDVRNTFAVRLHKDEEFIARLFSGSWFTLAKNLESSQAHEAAVVFRSIGALVYLVDADGNRKAAAVSQPAPDVAVESGVAGVQS